MVEAIISTPLPEKPAQKGKRRRKVVWSVNVFTVVLFMVDPRYALCEGKFKQVNKRFRKALEIVLRCIVVEATNYIEYSAPLVRELEQKYLQSDGFTAMRRSWTMLKNVGQSVTNESIGAAYLEERKYFSIMAFAVATTSMSDDTYEYDESLPVFDRNTIENIMYCSKQDKDDMRKLEKLLGKMIGELRYRAQACMTYLMTEQKLQDDEHHMYLEHFELLPWIMQALPPTLEVENGPQRCSELLCKVYRTFYEYIETLINYHEARNPCQVYRRQIMQRREGMIHAQERMKFMLKYEGLRTMREMKMLSQEEKLLKMAQSHQGAAEEGKSESVSMSDMFNTLSPQEKTKSDGTPVTLIDLIIDKRYAEREQDSDYYEEEYYFSELGSDDQDGYDTDDLYGPEPEAGWPEEEEAKSDESDREDDDDDDDDDAETVVEGGVEE